MNFEDFYIEDSGVIDVFDSIIFKDSDYKNDSSDVKLDGTKINIINNKYLDYLNEQISPRLFNLIENEYFEFGYESESERLILQKLSENSFATMHWLNQLYIDFFKNNVKYLKGILRIIGRFSQKSLFQELSTIALGSLSHQDEEVVELSLRAFENWGNKESLEILENTSEIKNEWLEEYRKNIINDLK